MNSELVLTGYRGKGGSLGAEAGVHQCLRGDGRRWYQVEPEIELERGWSQAWYARAMAVQRLF